MNWFKRAGESMQELYNFVDSALMALKYLHPEIDPLTADIDELAGALGETGKIPPGIDPLRFAAMVIFKAKASPEDLPV
jgi:hypothetical protein